MNGKRRNCGHPNTLFSTLLLLRKCRNTVHLLFLIFTTIIQCPVITFIYTLILTSLWRKAVPGIDEYKQGTYEVVNMTSAQFFEAIASTPPYHYFAGNQAHLSMHVHFNSKCRQSGNTVQWSVSVRASHGQEFYLEIRGKSSPQVYLSFHVIGFTLYRWTNAWIGPAGATTHTHYDIRYLWHAVTLSDIWQS